VISFRVPHSLRRGASYGFFAAGRDDDTSFLGLFDSMTECLFVQDTLIDFVSQALAGAYWDIFAVSSRAAG
jgi:hypothetical protein